MWGGWGTRGARGWAVAGVILAGAAGCTSPDYAKGDLQLDVDAALPAETEQARICVRGAWARSEGAGNGRLFIHGLPAGVPAEVVVDLIDEGGSRIARTAPATLSSDVPYAVTELAQGGGAICTAAAEGGAGAEAGDTGDTGDSGTGPTAPGEASWLLVVRFLGSGW